MKSAVVILVFLFLGANVMAQPADSTAADSVKKKKVNFIALPLAFYLPETELGFGAAGALNFRIGDQNDSLKQSQILFGGAYTLLNQVLSYANFNIFAKQEKLWFKGEVGYYRYFFYFYGLGPKSQLADEETYNVGFPRIRLDAMHKTSAKSYLGFRYIFDAFDITRVDSGGFLDQKLFLGYDGGSISGIGPLFILDTRDNIYSSMTGYKVEASATLFNQALGSSFNYSQVNLDISGFIQPFKKYKHVLGAQIISESQWGDVPFFALSQVGSPKMMRGFYRGRYTDKKQLSIQAEYRMPVIWKLQSVVFASTAFVGDSYDKFNFRDAIPAYGTGLRFVLKEAERLKVRIDVAKGIGEPVNFYVTFNEAF